MEKGEGFQKPQGTAQGGPGFDWLVGSTTDPDGDLLREGSPGAAFMSFRRAKVAMKLH